MTDNNCAHCAHPLDEFGLCQRRCIPSINALPKDKPPACALKHKSYTGSRVETAAGFLVAHTCGACIEWVRNAKHIEVWREDMTLKGMEVVFRGLPS